MVFKLKKIAFLFMLCSALTPLWGAGGHLPLSVQLANSEMKRNPESWMIDFVKTLKWDYCHGLELQAFMEVYNKTKNDVYLQYAKSYADTVISKDGKIFGYKPHEYNIDRVNPGKMLFQLYDATGEAHYLKAIHALREQMRTHPRTSDGGFWHKKVYPHQMWLDGLYMATPFLAEYALRFNEPALLDDAAHQILTMAKHGYDAKTGLYFHGYDESRTQKWANPITGQSPNFWSRSIGWYMMAMADALPFFPENHPKRAEMIKVFTDLSASLENFRDKKTGMWYQVTDKIHESDNYLESTGSAMFIYAWVKGAQHGFLPKSYLSKGRKAYKQFVKQFVRSNADGTVSITSCCAVAGLGGEKFYRDGSYAYYLSEPIRDNDPKAIGPFMMLSVMLGK